MLNYTQGQIYFDVPNRSGVSNTPALYSVGPEFMPQLSDRVYIFRFFFGLPHSLQANAGTVPQIDSLLFLSAFFLICYSPIIL
jgi:hypothetical protein